VGFDRLDELLIRCSTLIRYWSKGEEYSGAIYHLFIDFKVAYEISYKK
jgi:hypothetical protein